jgi:hypothetical protein
MISVIKKRRNSTFFSEKLTQVNEEVPLNIADVKNDLIEN